MAKTRKVPLTTAEMTHLAERRLRALLRRAQAVPGLARRVGHGPVARRPRWQVALKLVGSRAMTALNGQYRRKHYATDVLSFNAPEVFARMGHLGELVICLPTLRRQARELGHSDRDELEVLLVHGVLHLLGFDHELGLRESREMARWEGRLLPERVRGMIRRVG